VVKNIMSVTHVDYPVASQQPLDRGNFINDVVNLSIISPCQGGGSKADGGYELELEVLAPFKNIHYNKNNNNRAKLMSKEMTKCEQILWFKVLKSKKLGGYKFTKQKQIFNYIVDFYCSKLTLVIEIDGESHNNQIEYDKQRDNFLKSCNLKILRISNLEVLNNLEGVYNLLLNEINKIENSLNKPL
jgi:very-short-patch-repair endonuclease